MICAAWFALHFFLITVVCLRDTFSSLAEGTSVPARPPTELWDRAEATASAALGETLPAANPFRQGLAAYENCAGIEAGYGYFAPSVPSSCKLVFELHYPDGRVEYELPHVGGAAAGYRIATLLDNIQRFRYAPLREAIVKNLVYSIWQDHPDAVMVRAIFGVVSSPGLVEFRAGKRESYDELYSYDFRFRSRRSGSDAH